jgi:proteasome lid subunit RPN8/RPN11
MTKKRPTLQFLDVQLSALGLRARRDARSRRREVAGILVGRDGLVQLVELRNVSKRRGSFKIRGADIREAAQAARVLKSEVIGTFHSHIVSEAEPGPRDIREAKEGSLMFIYDTIGEEWRLWRKRGRRVYEVGFAILWAGEQRDAADGRHRLRAHFPASVRASSRRAARS